LIAREPNDVAEKYGSIESKAEELMALVAIADQRAFAPLYDHLAASDVFEADQTTFDDADVPRR